MAWNIRHQRPVVAARTKPAQLPERLRGIRMNDGRRHLDDTWFA